VTAQWQNPRGIRERLVVTGTLVLDTPAHLGTGDTESPLDVSLLLDPLEECPLLAGSSIAGALRHHVASHSPEFVRHLFGDADQEESVQSPLIVDDALASSQFDLELRDGVAIDPTTRTAEPRKKFDLDLLAAGTSFSLSFELLLLEGAATKLQPALALALSALEKGEIALGKGRRRGLGRCHVSGWTVHRYDMTTPDGLLSWLKGEPGKPREGPEIVDLLGVQLPEAAPPASARLEATFDVAGSLLIRSGAVDAGTADAVHLRSAREGASVCVISGTALAGALRSRALRIANTLNMNGVEIVERLFGYRPPPGVPRQAPTASRLWVDEAVIEEPSELVQTRVKLDRFTGGAYPGALFTEQPVFGGSATRVTIGLRIEDPKDGEVGLLLLLLKDLWTGDLPVGGGVGVGRGRLSGRKAMLCYREQRWTLEQRDDGTLSVEGDDVSLLEDFVRTFAEGGGSRE